MKINFEDLFDEVILQRGYRYYLEDAVHQVIKNGKCYEGLVYGTEIYEVSIELDKSGRVENMDCDCPYAVHNNCKHMAALLYYIENDGEMEKKKLERNKDNYERIIQKISKEELDDFVLKKLQSDIDFQNEFRSNFVQYFEKIPKEVYERRIQQSIRQAIGRNGFISYNETWNFTEKMLVHIDEALNLVKHNEYQAPFWIASLILEELIDIPIDDSDGTTSYIASSCREILEEILNKCKEDSLICEIFNWFIKCMKENTLDMYFEEIEDLLDEYFTDVKFVIERLKIIEENIQKISKKEDYYEYEIEKLIETKIALLYQLGKENEALETINSNLKYSSIRNKLISIEQENGNIKQVIKLLEDGIKVSLKQKHYGTVMDFAQQLLDVYQEQGENEKYKSLIEKILFDYDDGNFEYYKKLKELYSKEDWENERDIVIKKLEKMDNYKLIKIYIEEKYFDKLYGLLMKNPDYRIVVQYEEYLKKDYEEQLLKFYAKVAGRQAEYTGRNNYEILRQMLEHMKKLKGGKELVDKMVENYKVKYSNRRVMMEELNKIEKEK